MSATVVYRSGRTFKVELRPALDPIPRGWVVSERGIEPGVTWSPLSLWKTRREALASLEGNDDGR